MDRHGVKPLYETPPYSPPPPPGTVYLTHRTPPSVSLLIVVLAMQNPHATCPSTPCENSCCKSQPCQNNGLCKELCESARQKFNCTCPVDYKGKYCEVFKAKSCKELITKYPGIKSGTYDIHDSSDKSFPTFCDFTSEAGMAWTLVESFALKNNKQFKKPFFTDNPINENILQWDAFRLSMSHMKQLIGVSTHFRATCNFPTDGLSYTDYVRAKLSIVDLMNSVNSCFTLEFLNIRGHSCANCDSVFAHRSSYHPHLDSYHGATKSAFKEQGIGTVVSEDNFGYYASANPVHRCTSSQSATTQWWIGGKI